MNTYENERKTQNEVLKLLKNMGYIYISPEKISEYRDKEKDVILKNILKESLEKINRFEFRGESYKFSSKNINSAIDKIEKNIHDSQITANENIYNILKLGTALSEEEQTGSRQSITMKYIDFENIENNAFHVTEEFIVERVTKDESHKVRKPDIVLFVNGIPLGVIELKSAMVEMKEGISQMLRNQSAGEIPNLFQYAQILLAGNSHECKYATTKTPEKFWSTWKEEDKNYFEPPISRMPSALDKGIFSIFSKERFLELVQNFILYDNNIKKIARYQQYFVIKKVMNRIKDKQITDRGHSKRNGGLIWHTQGSGKSLTMVMLAMMIKNKVKGAKIIVVTDRKDLDRQLSKTFFQSGYGVVETAKTGQDLLKKIKDGKTMITTVINKFLTVVREKETEENENIFILVDEAHRSQSSTFHAAMKKVFPNGCYLGFTGTPLLKSEKSSFDKFGGLIHSYKIDQAVEDKAVLPLLYEGRFVDQWINDEAGMERKYNLISKNLNSDQKVDLEKKWIRFKKIASSERRLEIIALDINEHFKKNYKDTGFKGMIIASSKRDAIKYFEIFEEYGNIKTAFVISKEDGRKGYNEVDGENKKYVSRKMNEITKEHGSYDIYESNSIDEFLHGDEIDLLIVVDKLITGFDAPKASVLYVDKSLKEHQLLQAIARVNRLYPGKDFGYIIDYRGLLGNLDRALTSYSEALGGFDEEDLIGTVTNITVEIEKITEKLSKLNEIFEHLSKNDFEEYCVYLEDKELREKFYQLLRDFGRTLKLVLGSEKSYDLISEEDMNDYKKALIFYEKLRQAVRLRYHEEIDFEEYEPHMQKLMDTYISAGETNQLTRLVNIFESGFSKEVQRLHGARAQADAIRSATTKIINEKREENPNFYDSIIEKINRIIEEYKTQRISEEEYLNSMNEIKEEVKKEAKDEEYSDKIKNSGLGKSIYSNIKEQFLNVLDNKEELEIFVEKIVVDIKEVAKKPDWESNVEVSKQLTGKIEDYIWDLEDKNNVSFEVMDNIIESVLLIGKSRLGKKGK